MQVLITKEFMYKETEMILQSIFKLPELLKVEIKGIVIKSIDDECAIRKAIDECFNDMYSDVDIGITVKLNRDDYNSNSAIYSDCLRRIGINNNVLGLLHFNKEERGEVIRVCKTNGMRFDLIINAICSGQAFELPHEDISDNQRRANEFWFIAVQALVKLMRKDYLISSHLTHKLVQEGLVLQMNMRDKDKKTTFHRYGYNEELIYLSIYNNEDISNARTSDTTYNYISKLLYSAVKSYDKLLFSISKSYKSRLENYLEIWSFYDNAQFSN